MSLQSRFLPGLFLTSMLALPMPVAAQAPAPTPSFVAEGFMVLVPPRSLESIDADLTASDAALLEAQTAVSAAMSQRDGARTNVEAKKLEIAAIKRQQSTAKANKNEVELASLTSSRKALERELSLLEQRESLRDAEIDLARQSVELANLTRRALSFERELVLKRLERTNLTEPGPVTSSLDRVILDLEAQTLAARVELADKAVDVATREKRVAERQLKINEARRRIVVN